mmetsp:Transcript_35613/g.106092  ORF Transcript_35613/g.106092 Transcript_35613/m.106092 type:complete len:255 (-) Transcript_35613:40-804(-)
MLDDPPAAGLHVEAVKRLTGPRRPCSECLGKPLHHSPQPLTEHHKLLRRQRPRAVRVRLAQDSRRFAGGQVEAELAECAPQLLLGERARLVGVEAEEDLADCNLAQRRHRLLSHSLDRLRPVSHARREVRQRDETRHAVARPDPSLLGPVLLRGQCQGGRSGSPSHHLSVRLKGERATLSPLVAWPPLRLSQLPCFRSERAACRHKATRCLRDDPATRLLLRRYGACQGRPQLHLVPPLVWKILRLQYQIALRQ